MAKFFVSYSRSVKDEVQKVVDLLRASGHDVWWDGDIPIMADWWATILDKIEWCEVFIFVTSEKSVESPYCIAELKYANDRQRPILPFMLEDPTLLELPPQLPSRNQWLLYDGNPAYMLEQINTAYKLIEWYKHNDISTRRPPEPNKGGVSLAKQYQQARQDAQDLQFNKAKQRLQNIKRLDYGEWGTDCDEWLGRISSYEALIDLVDHVATHDKASRDWQSHVQQYGSDFDPYNINQLLTAKPTLTQQVLTVSAPPQHTVSMQTLTTPTSIDLMPDPFDWIEIPNKDFSIAKYPITNAQFAVFKEDNGYFNKEWWLQSGWKERESKNWKAPRYWHDPKWNKGSLPVVGVSWHEAIAFSLWLSRNVGERIELPTEEQWQFAAQGDDNRQFPWGTVWNADRCNNSGGNANWGQTSTVTKYENIGDSPFGVVDMLGNVWEWCMEWDEEKKPLRGGCWRSNQLSIEKQTTRRSVLSYNLWGFRLVKYHK